MLELAGRTTITAVGNRGIRLHLSRAWAIDGEEWETPWTSAFKFERISGTYAFVGVAPTAEGCARSELTQICMSMVAIDIEGAPYGVKQIAKLREPFRLPEGDLEVFVLTDGVARLTMRPEGFDGHLEVMADRRVHGQARRLPETCLVDSACGAYRSGGIARRSPYGTFAMALAYSSNTRTREEVTPSNALQPAHFQVCMYPHPILYPSESARPEDHPYGCDPVAGEPVPSQPDVLLRLAYDAACPCYSGADFLFSYAAEGPTYIGAITGNLGEGGARRLWGGWGVWMTQGLGRHL